MNNWATEMYYNSWLFFFNCVWQDIWNNDWDKEKPWVFWFGFIFGWVFCCCWVFVGFWVSFGDFLWGFFLLVGWLVVLNINLWREHEVNYAINCSEVSPWSWYKHGLCALTGNSTNSALLPFWSLGILCGISRQKALFKISQKFFSKLKYLHNPERSISSLQQNIPDHILMAPLKATLLTKNCVKFC